MASVERIEAAGRWLVSVGGTATPGELGAALGGLGGRAQADLTKSLRSASWVNGGKGSLVLTPTGWTRFAAVGPTGAGEVLDRVVEQVWPGPLYAHQALFRLVVSSVVARWHLHDVRPERHLTFVSRGGEGTGKTSLFRLACDLLGVEPLEAIVEPGSENAASLGGRRAVGKGGQISREVPAIALLPLVVFDDADKMPAELRQAFWPYLRGDVRQRTEGQIRELRPVAAVTYNPRSGQDPDALLPPGWQRRSVLFDADYGLGQRKLLSDALTRYSRSAGGPWRRELLRLDALRPPAATLTDEAMDFLAGVPVAFLDPDRAWPRAGLELAALGRAALLGDHSDARATAATAIDYLAVASTVTGTVREDWPALAADVLDWENSTGSSSMADVVARYEVGRRQRTLAARTQRVVRHAESLALVGYRGELVGQLQQAARSIQALPPSRRPVAQGIREQLGELRRRAGNAKTMTALEDLAVLAADPLRRAAELRRQVDDETAAADRQRQQSAATRRAEAQERDRAAAERQQWLRAATRRARAEIAQVRDIHRRISRLHGRKPSPTGPDPLPVLREIALPDGRQILAYRPDPAAATARPSLLRTMLGPALPSGRWHSTLDPAVNFPGEPFRCWALKEWGINTRAITAPALRYLEKRDEELCQAHGLPRRKSG